MGFFEQAKEFLRPTPWKITIFAGLFLIFGVLGVKGIRQAYSMATGITNVIAFECDGAFEAEGLPLIWHWSMFQGKWLHGQWAICDEFTNYYSLGLNAVFWYLVAAALVLGYNKLMKK